MKVHRGSIFVLSLAAMAGLALSQTPTQTPVQTVERLDPALDQLVDPNTGKVIDTQDLDAWTRPGDMQLKKDAWDKYLD